MKFSGQTPAIIFSVLLLAMMALPSNAFKLKDIFPPGSPLHQFVFTNPQFQQGLSYFFNDFDWPLPPPLSQLPLPPIGR